MTARLRTHHMVLIGLGSALAAITACSAPEIAKETDAKKTTQASSVVVDILDVNGTSLGSCSGTLIAPKLVLTAGHCIAGASHWKVSHAAGVSEASVASTPWKNFRSDLSHPEHSDVGLILLDTQIKLDSYPQIATEKVKDGTKGVRFHRVAETATEATATNTRISGGEDQGFRLNYLLEMAKDEWLDTGGAVLDASGKIVGVVSGLGKQSGMLHVARVDGFATWMKSAVSCSNGLSTRTWGSGNSQNGGGGYGGTPEKSGGGGWGGWGGGGGSWGSSAGGYGGGGGKGGGGGMMDGGATVPGSSGNGGGGSSGSSGSSGDGSSGSSGTTGGGSSGDGTPGNPGSSSGGAGGDDASNTCPGIPVCSGDDCGAGSNGNNGGTGSDGSSSGSNGSSSGSDGSSSGSSGAGSSGSSGDGSSGSSGTNGSSGSSGDGSSGSSGAGSSGSSGSSGNNSSGGSSGAGSSGGNPGGDGENCSGSADNPDVCPPAPDSASCSGPNCGGCGGAADCADSNIDYGACPSCSGGAGSGPIVK